MKALKLRKDMSKPGLLREVFDLVVDPVSGREFSIGACLMSGLAMFLEKHASLLQFDLSMRGDTVEDSESAPSVRSCAGSLRHDPAPSSGSGLASAVSAGVSAGTATRPARQGPAADVGVAWSLSGSYGRHRHLFLPAGPRSVLSAGPASQRLGHVLPSTVVCGAGASGSAAGAADGGGGGSQWGRLDQERL